MITELRVKDYSCLRDVVITDITPLHAFIGPNGSGKTTILDAIWDADEKKTTSRASRCSIGRSTIVTSGELVNGVGVLRCDLHLKDDSAPVATTLSNAFLRGQNISLATIYDHVLNRGDGAFTTIASDVCRLFPAIDRLDMINVPYEALGTIDGGITKHLRAHLTGTDTWIDAKRMSKGLLHYLAFAAIPYTPPVSVLLVMQPETGFHPARIADVMRILRKVSETTSQVIIETHSPLVVNELKPHEVTLVAQNPVTGTKTKRICDTPNFAERSEINGLGELWLSYGEALL